MFVTGRKTYRITSILANLTVVWRLNYRPLQWPEICEQWHFLFRPEQRKSRQNNHKDFHGLRIRKRMVREGRRNSKKCSRFDILGRSSVPQHQLLLLLVNLILGSLAFTQDQMSVGGFFSFEISYLSFDTL